MIYGLSVGGPDLGCPFVELTEYHAKARRQVRFFEMTRKGFVLLAMGFTGRTALAFKSRYIDEFDRMEAQQAALKAPQAPALPNFMDAGEAAIAWAEQYRAREAAN